MSDPSPPVARSARLGRLGPRDISQAALESASYSRRVGFLRWMLPLLVIGGLAFLFLWPQLKRVGVTEMVVQNVPNLMVEKVNLTGLDAKKQPYALTADRALQAGNLKNVIDLEKPKGELSLKGGGWISGGALQGRFDQKTEKLWLGGAVEFFHDDGYRFLADELFVDMKKNLLWSEKPVLFQGSFGEVHGKAFRALEGGAVLVFKGPAKARLRIK
jgi:lipopolysaccharide export system protein LptC